MTLSIIQYRLTITARIGDIDVDNVAGFTSTFALNTIPSATITLATGRNVETLNSPSFRSSGVLSGDPLPVFVWATFGSEDGAINRQLLFEGETAGAGWTRTANNASFVIHIRHWLAHLNFASALSSNVLPGSISNFTYPATDPVIALKGEQDSLLERVGFVGTIKLESVDGTADLWDNNLLPHLLNIVESEPFDNRLQDNIAKNDNKQKVLDALSRTRRVPLNGDPTTAPGAPLTLQLIDPVTQIARANVASVAAGIRKTLTDRTAESFAYTSIWGKIVGDYAPEFLFEVVPLVSSALMVPNSGALRVEPWKIITGDDQLQVELSGEVPQPLQAVGIMHPVEDSVGLNMHADFPLNGLAGCYGLYQGNTRGAFLLKSPPSWLSASLTGYSGRGEGQDNKVKDASGDPDLTVISSLDELEDAPLPNPSLPNPPTPVEEISATRVQLSNIASAYAKQLYISEMLKSRIGTLTGPMRYDIAPGSTIRLDAPEELLPEIPQSERTDFFAKVIQVTTVVDAQAASAATTLTLSHCRTSQENAVTIVDGRPADIFSAATPALYVAGWRGGSLSEQERIS